jgi:putative multiple sugar transport system substrate-binding protein
VITGQDAEEASVQYIIDGKQSMTVLKDVRTLVADAIAAAIAYLEGKTPAQTTTYNNGMIDVPAKPSVVVTVDKSNVQAAVIDSGYWPAADFTGLP